MAGSPLSHVLRELRRRKVVRAVLAYAVAAFVIIQAADPLADVLLLPEWTLRLVFALAILGTIAAGLGDTETADRADAWLRDVDWPNTQGWSTLWRARLAAGRGDAEQAVALLRQSLSEGRPFSTWIHTDPAFRLIADHPAFQEVLEPQG